MKKLFTLGLLVFSAFGFSQNKMLTMQDAVVNQYYNLGPERLQQLQWINADTYTYIKDNKVLTGIASHGKKQPKEILSLDDLNKSFSALNGKKLKRFPSLQWQNTEVFKFEYNQNLYTYNLGNGTLIHTDSLEISAEAENREDAPVTGHIAFTVKNNLYILKGDEVIAVEQNQNEGIVSGQAVSRSEFGITEGIFWSPDGTKLAYYVKDETEVKDYPIVDWTTQPATVTMIKYPMAGTEHTEKVFVKVYDVQTGQTTTLLTGEPNTQYLTNVAWSPDSREVYIAHLNRDQNHMELKRYEAETGKLDKLLFEEKSDKYVEPLQPVHFVKGSDNKFIWESSRSGNNHLYLYNTNGKMLRQLTSGNWNVMQLEGFDESGDYAYYTSTAISPLQRDLYSVKLSNGSIKRKTSGSGTHRVSLAADGNYFINQFTNYETPLMVSVVNTNNGQSFEIHSSGDPLKEYKLGAKKHLVLKDYDGGDLYARMILPVDFDSTKTYPVIVYLYGGPHVQMLTNTWGMSGHLWFEYMAQRGYIVWTLDSRGSGNRGQAWEQHTFRQLGKTEMEDQLRGIEFLKSKSYVDASRIGIHGWSFGGFMTMSLMSRHPGVFKAGVAGGPVIDWSYYETMYTERYMDTPDQNPEGYEENNLLNYVEDLEGELLIIHGSSDPVVLWQHTMLYLKKAVELKKQVDYFVYPMHEHNVRGYDRIHLMQKITDYFEDYL
jgi:dipeptidyl-peptidase-4